MPNLLNDAEQLMVKQAIIAAEKHTSGEIRVYIANNSKQGTLDAAASVFAKLEMHKTAERNGVLIYVAIENKSFAIIGDVGINTKVPADFWESIKGEMQSYFVQGNFSTGLCTGIAMAGEALSQYFPYHTDDVNELGDDIVFGDE